VCKLFLPWCALDQKIPQPHSIRVATAFRGDKWKVPDGLLHIPFSCISSLAVRAEWLLDSSLLRWMFDMNVTPRPHWACTATIKNAAKRIDNALNTGPEAHQL